MDLIQISVAIIMLVAAVAVIVWHRSSVAAVSAASSRRMMDMMEHFGLDPRAVTHGGRESRAVGKYLGRECSRCRHGDHCERWLAGKAKGSNTFCPNAEAFRILAFSASARLL